MKYAYGDDKLFIYSQSQWALSPNQAITSEIVNLLRDLELFSSIQISKSRSRNDMLLEISIDEFMQYFSEDGSRSYVNVVLSLTLLDTRTKTIFATKTFRQKSDVERLSAEGGVESLNTALRTILLSSSIWFERVCK
jgi:cholesterol transport system auxiliary component